MPAQLALFSDERKPEGLRYQPDFITREEEQDLISHIVGLPLSPFQFGAFEAKRRVASFGWRYNYTSHALEKAGDLPAWIAPFVARVESFAGLPSASVEQLLVTEYEAGAGIGWHRDKPHFGKVFGLSLGSSCKFRFRRKLPPRLGALRVRSATPLSLHDGGPIPQRVGAQHPARRVGAILDHLSHHGPDVYLTCSTCPRISPSGNFAV